MTTTAPMPNHDEAAAMLGAARRGDESEFSLLVERHRRELQVHCYRMLGSFEDSEDLTQETFLRAWRKRESFEGRSSIRSWLYKIATNACLDALERRPRPAAAAPADAGAGPARASEVPWLQPYPDHLVEGLVSSDAEPETATVAKETIELAFLVAIQHLPPRPRAVLILRDVLGWSAKDTAALLDVSVAAANSALQRARSALKRHLPEPRLEWAPGSDPSAEERNLLAVYIEASDRGDAEAIAALMTEDARFSMPPTPDIYVGRKAIVDSWTEGGFGTEKFGQLRCVATSANLQPAVACYCRRPDESEFRAMAVDVLRIEEGSIAEITTFAPEVFAALGLPQTLA